MDDAAEIDRTISEGNIYIYISLHRVTEGKSWAGGPPIVAAAGQNVRRNIKKIVERN